MIMNMIFLYFQIHFMNSLPKLYVDNMNCIFFEIIFYYLYVYGHMHMFHALQ